MSSQPEGRLEHSPLALQVPVKAEEPAPSVKVENLFPLVEGEKIVLVEFAGKVAYVA
jgi:hypothetical protein